MRPYVVTSALAAAAATVGSLGTKTDTAWYRGLDKPSWQPPPLAFPLVWTPLYGLIAWGTGRAIERSSQPTRIAALTGADLVVNAGWNWAFFARQSTAGGLGVVLAMDALNVALLREAAKADKAAAAALAPYVAWTGFATVLNAAIWWRNRR
ncbi:MAG: TspO/MBR family protein [Nocardioides sp.]